MAVFICTMDPVCHMVSCVHEFRHGQKRQQGEHGDNGNILKQKDGKAGLSAVAFHQPLFV